jgi:hypothetical protein
VVGFNGKIGREHVLKLVVGKYSLHEISNEIWFRATDLVANNNMMTTST